MATVTVHEGGVPRKAAEPAEASPSEQITKKANQVLTFTAKDGRQIKIKKLSAMDKLQLFKVTGDAQKNEGYFNYLLTAYHVASIDGEPPVKGSVLTLEAIVNRLGDAMDEVAVHMVELYAEDAAAAEQLQATIKNSQSTPTS
jgi:hypothetical protein